MAPKELTITKKRVETLRVMLETASSIFPKCSMAMKNRKMCIRDSSIYGNATAGVIADKDKEIEHLKQLLKEKERLIQVLMNK